MGGMLVAWGIRMHFNIFPFPEFDSMLWNVPVTIATKNSPEAVKFVLDKRSDTVEVEGVGEDDWIMVSWCPLRGRGFD